MDVDHHGAFAFHFYRLVDIGVKMQRVCAFDAVDVRLALNVGLASAEPRAMSPKNNNIIFSY